MAASKTAFQILEIFAFSDDVLGNRDVLVKINCAMNIFTKKYYFVSLDYIHDIGDSRARQSQAEYLLLGLAGLAESFESKDGFEHLEELVQSVLV